MKQIVFFIFAVLAFAACEKQFVGEEINMPNELTEKSASFSSAELMDLQIIEGQGLGDVVTLGMSREDISQITTGIDCFSSKECSFRLSAETGPITVHFNNDTVDFIRIGQFGVFPEYLWSTTAGATSLMSPTEVAELYDPSEIVHYDYVYTDVVAKEYGYTYFSYLRYGDGGSQRVVTHEIYARGGRPETFIQVFQGIILVQNPKPKSTIYNVNLSITQPDGQVVEVPEFSVSIPGGSSTMLFPNNYLPLDGPLGTYTYTATLLSQKGKSQKVAGTSSGSFQLIQVVE
ncbi:hypothetical protein D1614_11745 [Maribellus luteus]|uniref:Uncharacterized protein n=1 Tax=Maribellus luteus TaxID=2305463 RepID=A0A399T076_9BACT|nr:hypothetical protein [Maribellus luteus]RIJ48389.1 hypothetical protein D1614_11745 [Maribellus luteus]